MKYPSHAELSELTPEERLQLIEDVWETLADLQRGQDIARLRRRVVPV
jgi:hypothetical protein